MKKRKQDHMKKAVREANKLGGWHPYLMKHNKGYKDEYDRLKDLPICEKCLMVHGDEGCYWNGPGIAARMIRARRKAEGLPI
jgi:hypothetical protein